MPPGAARTRLATSLRTRFRKDWSNRCGNIAIFVIFNMAPPPCWIFKKIVILRTIPCRGPLCVTVPNFIKIGHTVAEIWRFYGFKNGGRPPSWIFEIRIFWRSGPLREPFCFSILNFVKIAAILDFQKFEILTVRLLYGSNMRHCTKSHQNRSNGCRDMVI